MECNRSLEQSLSRLHIRPTITADGSTSLGAKTHPVGWRHMGVSYAKLLFGLRQGVDWPFMHRRIARCRTYGSGI
jgi:hypothetical protein